MKKKNVRQIGQVKGNRRIYIEDYAMTYLKQLAVPEAGEPGGTGPRMAVLAGRREKEEQEDCFYIYGVLDFAVEVQGGGHRMNSSTWTGIYAGMKAHFPDLEILGWYLTREDVEVEQEEWITGFHREYFPGDNRIFFYYNPAELEERMFCYEDGRLKKQGGYFVFYEKNEAMQNLLIARNQQETGRVRGLKDAGTFGSGAAEPAPEADLPPEERVVLDIRRTIEARQEKAAGNSLSGHNTSGQKAGSRPKAGRSHSFAYLAGSIVAVVLLAVCLLGIQYTDRLNGLEETIRQLSENAGAAEENLEPSDPDESPDPDGPKNPDDSSDSDDVPDPDAPKDSGGDTGDADGDESDPAGGVLEVETLPGGVIKDDTGEEDSGEDSKGESTEDSSGESGEGEGASEEETAPVTGPEPAEETSSTETALAWSSYVVREGDTLLGICLRQYQDANMVDEVMEANQITDPDGILVGDVLILPGS